MDRLIKKYKNRRLYDTKISQYITIEQLQDYVVEGILFRVEDSVTGNNLTNTILLQIIVEMESGPTQFLSSEVLRQIISLANHPMHVSLKTMMEQLFYSIENPLQSKSKNENENNLYKQASDAWSDQMQQIIKQWQSAFKG